MDKSNDRVMSALNGTKTEQNLNRAFDDEAAAYTKYKLFAQRANDEGNHAAGRLFDETADNERQHASLWLGYLDGIGSTRDNLESAIAGEISDTETYPEMARQADEEGFNEIAEKFRLTAQVESNHLNTYKDMLDSMDSEPIYDANTHWQCTNCGFDSYGNVPPERCPLCSYTKDYFKKS